MLTVAKCFLNNGILEDSEQNILTISKYEPVTSSLPSNPLQFQQNLSVDECTSEKQNNNNWLSFNDSSGNNTFKELSTQDFVSKPESNDATTDYVEFNWSDWLPQDCDQPEEITEIRSCSEEQHTDILVGEAKFYLLKKLHVQQKTGIDGVNCQLIFSDDKKLAKLTGSGNVISEARLQILEMMSSVSTCTLNLSKGVVKLLLSTRGSSWFEEQLRTLQISPSVALFTGDNMNQLVAQDENTMESARKMLDNQMKSERLPFGDHHLKFLQSTSWVSIVTDMESRAMVNISTEYNDKCIIVDGATADVNRTLVLIKNELKCRIRATRSLMMKYHVVVRLVEFHAETIKLQVSQRKG